MGRGNLRLGAREDAVARPPRRLPVLGRLPHEERPGVDRGLGRRVLARGREVRAFRQSARRAVPEAADRVLHEDLARPRVAEREVAVEARRLLEVRRFLPAQALRRRRPSPLVAGKSSTELPPPSGLDLLAPAIMRGVVGAGASRQTAAAVAAAAVHSGVDLARPHSEPWRASQGLEAELGERWAHIKFGRREVRGSTGRHASERLGHCARVAQRG